jgi:hypothetical protein
LLLLPSLKLPPCACMVESTERNEVAAGSSTEQAAQSMLNHLLADASFASPSLTFYRAASSYVCTLLLMSCREVSSLRYVNSLRGWVDVSDVTR